METETCNLCAHFVSHALGLKIGMLCGDMKYKSRGKGASIRVNGSEMGSSPSKHIGIYCGDSVWHYSNTNDKVVKDSPESFLIKFNGVYGSKTKMYFGDFGFDIL